MLRERITGEPHTTLRYQCSPFHLNSALYPIIEQIEFAAGFAREDTPEQKLDKMEAMLVGSPAQRAESAPLFAALLSLPTDRYPPLGLSPQKQKEKTLEALVGQVEALSRRPAAADGVRGRALDRSDQPGTARRAGAAVARAARSAGDHLPAGVHASLARISRT